MSKYRPLIPLCWIGLAGIISMITQDWLYFSSSFIFSAGWYVCYIFNGVYKK